MLLSLNRLVDIFAMNTQRTKRVISFCLWGDNPKYTQGAIRNVELAASVYPGWVPRFYTHVASVPADVVERLERDAEVIPTEIGDYRCMPERFRAADDPTVARMISRDTDSRLSKREKEAVDEWIADDTAAHCMRDHPLHDVVIMGGMWGLRGGVLPMNRLLDEWPVSNHIQTGQSFLASRIWPLVRGSVTVHDEFRSGRIFPSAREGLEFVGDVFLADDRPEPGHREKLQRWLSANPAKLAEHAQARARRT